MKLRYLTLLLICLFLFSCETEEVQVDTQTLRVPEWLKGNYEGVHTQEFLLVNSNLIRFKFDDITYHYTNDDVLEIQEDQNSYTVITTTVPLKFNKTTLNSEINLRYGELNLGWFRKIDLQ
jgi:hypothetical protein